LKKFLENRFVRSGYPGAIGAGLLLAMAFPNFDVAGFAWIAPALMLAGAQGKSPGAAFRIGYVAGISFWLVSLDWLLRIPVTGFPILGWFALSAFVALYFGIWTWLLVGKIGFGNWTRRNLWALAGAAVWVGLEMIRARFLGGFPWNLLGTSQFQLTPLIQIASVTGVYGVSFLVVWVSLSLFSAVRAIFSKPDGRFAWQPEVFLPLLVVAILFAVGTLQMRTQPASEATPVLLRVTLIQPSVPQTLIWDSGANSNRFQQLLALTEIALTNKTDLLIWPEAALPDFDDASYAAITNLVRSHHVWMIFNADDVLPKANPSGTDKYDSYNSAFLFNPNGEFVKVYHKQKLVIFGEYIPLVRWLPFIKWFTPIQGGYEAGDNPGNFEMSGWSETPSSLDLNQKNIGLDGVSPHRTVNTAPLICFEDMFPQTARDSARDDTDFLVNLTNDGWFGEGAEQWQQAAAGIFRAVENGVPLVRSCNNGLTCWIDAHGRVRQIFKDKTGGIYGAGAMTFELPLPDEKPAPTFYNRHGDWFGWSCVILTAMVAARRIFARVK
jgi:apolipoprotein N-acyltransferase